MIGADAAFSLPCCGSSMAILTVPLAAAPLGAAPLGAAPLGAAPVLAGVDAAGVLQADRTSSDAPASALSVPEFHSRSSSFAVGRVASVDLGRRTPNPIRSVSACLTGVPGAPPWARSTDDGSSDRSGRSGGTERRTAQDADSDGAQVAAEAMPYHRHRRTECNSPSTQPGRWLSSSGSPPPRGSVDDTADGRPPIRRRMHIQSAPADRTRCPGPRGIPDPPGSNHRYRSARRAQRRLRSSVRCFGLAGFRRPAATAGLSSAGEHLHRRGSA